MKQTSGIPPAPSTGPATVTSLGQRSCSLRRQARHVNPVLAQAYRRRASEIELQAWVLRTVAGPDLAAADTAA